VKYTHINSIDSIKVLYDTPIDSTITTYWLEQEQTDKLFEGVEPYRKPCMQMEIGDKQRERISKYYERIRGNS
jgi:hypothetical protein